MNNHIRAYINETIALTTTELQAMKTFKEKEYRHLRQKIDGLIVAEQSESVISLMATLTKEMLAVEIEWQTLDYALELALWKEQEGQENE